jgi:large subunit ribosomal protein L15
MPLQRRLPKRGFTNIFKKEYSLVHVKDLAERFADGAEVTPGALAAARLISRPEKPVKLLSDGDIAMRLKVRVHAASKAAVAKIEAAGGEVSFIEPGGDFGPEAPKAPEEGL